GQTSVTVTLTPIFQSNQEGLETATFTAEGTSATVTIADEPAVTVAVGDATAAELGPDTGTFTVTRGGALTYDRFVQGAITGTAVSGSDYTLSASGGVFANTTVF